MLRIASDYYKELFKKEDRNDFRMNPNFFSEGEKVTPEENEALEAAFSEEEVKKAVFDSYSDGAPGPDGIPFFFLSTLLGTSEKRPDGYVFRLPQRGV